MGYIVCDKCGGYYELQPGESPERFSDKCECDGDLRYVQNLNTNAHDLKPFTTRYVELLNLKAIATGCIIFIGVFVIDSILIGTNNFSYVSDNLIYLEALIGGIAAGYMADPEYRTGLFNGALYGFIAGILLLTFIIVISGVSSHMSFFTVSMIISGSVGALIGTTFQKLIRTSKRGN